MMWQASLLYCEKCGTKICAAHPADMEYLQCEICGFNNPTDFFEESMNHNHACYCGTAADSKTPHITGASGCVRFMTKEPEPRPNNRWFVDGNEITDFTLRQQRGYHQHECGCWSRCGGSTNSIAA